MRTDDDEIEDVIVRRDDEHELSLDCPCLPEEVDGLIVHNAFDGREFDEIAAEIAR